MNQSDFRGSGTNEFEFGFSSSSAAQSGYGRARPRLRRAKLRRKCDDVGLDERGKSSSMFGLSTELPNEFRKLNVRESDGAGGGGGGFSSVFQFRSMKSHDGGGVCVGMLPEELRKLNLGHLGRGSDGKDESGGFDSGNGFNEAMLNEKMESVRIEERVGVSSTGANGELLYNENLKNGIKDEFKDNVFFRGLGASQIPAMGSTDLPNVGSAFSGLNAPTASSSATPFWFRDQAKFSQGTGKFAGSAASGFNSSLNRKPKFIPKRHTDKHPNWKKKNENEKLDIDSQEHPAYVKPQFGSKEFSSTPESPQSYSPMDVSPYPEVTVNTRLSNETSVSSEEPLTQGNKFQSSENNTNDENCPVDDELVCATQQLNIGEVCIDVCGTNMDNSEACASEHIGEIHADSASESETESFKSAPNDLDSNIDISTSTATKTCSTSNSRGDRTTHFYSVCDNESISGTKFTFTASTSSREPASMRRYRKINRRKEHDSYRSTATSKVSNAFSGCLQFEDSLQNKEKPDSTRSHLKAEMDCYTNASKEVINETSGTSAATIVAQETCEKWRLRGNQAYANGDSSKAEEYYTRGVESIPIYEKSRVCLKALTLCYSNRAATRMAMGRLREAIEDCKLAAGIDPSFLKGYLRAANCFLALGEFEEALKYFKYCLQPGMDVGTDRRVLIEASEGLQNAQKAAQYMNLSIASIQRGAFSDAENALSLVGKALTICLYSEKLLEIKGEALFLLQKYSKVIHLCEDSYGFAERNRSSCVTDHNLWRCRLMLKSYFFLGKLEDALAVLAKNESLRKGSTTLESLIPLAATVKILLQNKGAGNEAYQTGKYGEAIEHYTAALSFNVDSHPFAAICFCNRAAAYKALGKTVDAIADCNLAITLERDYLKAISRRASLYESIRDYGQAASDMERIISLLKEQANGGQQTTLYEKATKSSIPIDLRQAQMQLATLEKQGSKGIPLNFYLILGVESVASAAEIKKAYRNAALKHHPDKAGQILAKGDSGRNSTWKEIAEEIHKNADRLFKLIGEAYTVLSDPSQRSTYDAEEEYRNLLKNNRESYASRTHVDARNYPFEASMSRRQWNDYRKSYGR